MRKIIQKLAIKKKKFFVLLMALTTFLFYRSMNVFATPTSDAIEQLGEELTKIAEILYKNKRFFTQNTWIKDALRYIEWGIIKLLKWVADGCQGLYRKTIGMADFSSYQGLNDWISVIQVVCVAIMALSIVWYGIILILNHKKKNNILTKEEFLEQFYKQGEFTHDSSNPFLNFVSSVLDITIIKPIIEACTGEDLITGEDLTDLERGLKVVFAVVDLVSLGGALAATKLSEVGLKEGLKAFGKTVVIDFAGNTAACGAGALGEAFDWPVPVTIMLSLAAGITVSVSGNKLLFKNADGITIGEKTLGDDEVKIVEENLDSVQHAVGSASQAQSVLDGIDPKYFNKESRFGGGFYVGNDSDTIVAELAEHGNTAKYAIRYDLNLNGQKVLDLTNLQVANEWGYIQNLTSTEACQEIGELARNQGYNVIKFQSYRGEGINYVIYNNFDDIITPQMVTPVN